MAVLALVVLFNEGAPVLHKEQRVGRRGKHFTIYKFRTLRVGSNLERRVAPEDDPRITGVGLRLRRWRLDEFPQLVNVLCGHMSLVGPRPMPPSHAAKLPDHLREALLSVRPGMTDNAAIHFLAEDAVLAGLDDPEAVYLARFLPEKARMQSHSIEHWSLVGDFIVLGRTLAQLWSPRDRDRSASAMRRLLQGGPSPDAWPAPVHSQ